MSNLQKVAIYSCGGFGREVAWQLDALIKNGTYNLLGHIEDDESLLGKTINDQPVFSLEKLKNTHQDCLIIVAIGDPETKQRVVEKCNNNGFSFATVIHPKTEISKFVKIGEGTIICPGSILTVNIEIGKHVHVNLDCTIGHDVKVGDFTTLSPGVHVSGNVHIEESVFVGTGAAIINGTTDKPLIIRKGTVIGAGACVTKSTEAGSLYVGVPAKQKKIGLRLS